MTTNTLMPAGLTLDAPVKQVTLLEDRAQVKRSGSLTLEPGQHTVLVPDVAPVLQDLSLRAEASGGARVVDARVRRTLKVTKDERPEVARALEKDIEQLTDTVKALSEDRALTQQRRQRLEEILGRGFSELPEDISWGLTAPQWEESLEGLFSKVRALRERGLSLEHQLRDANETRARLVSQRQAFDRPDTRFTAWLEADVLVTGKASVEVSFEYTVPNALWRPMHSARLADGALFFESRACVWQNTGEAWTNARLVFSTARASLGIEPPLLSDDLLTAQKKQDKLVVQAREVVIQKAKAGPGAGGGGAPVPSTVELPGVDDGGEIRNLEAKGPCTVPSDGRPTILPLFDFKATPKQKHLAFPELELRVFMTSLQKNEARFPILAGPVELLLQNGFVGWTKVLFVAAGEEFQLSFGPDDSLRIARAEREKEQESHVDKWKTMTQSVWLYLSNVGDEPKTVEVKERMPVSELEQVKVELGAKRSSPKPDVDAHGFLTWTLELLPHSQQQVKFAYDVSTAPGVQGM
ncbi:MAG: mucoidy inhibitor MuiA family protein [Myxococcales bacterium]|nr:mucoidy inhibitor MuiA family protein [Myxococcales bacterium]